MIDLPIRDEIKRLRSLGMMYSEICDEIGRLIPKGTLSYICKDVKLPEEYFVRHKQSLQENLKVAREKALVANTEKLRLRFEKIHEEASRVVTRRSENDYEKIALAMLYLGEGSKYRSYRGLSLGSSDPGILRTYIALLERCYYKKRTDFRVRIQCRDDQNQRKLEVYWTKELGISLDALYPTYSDKRTVGKPTAHSDYKGVCVVSCSGADIQLELDAIARLYEQEIWGISSFG